MRYFFFKFTKITFFQAIKLVVPLKISEYMLATHTAPKYLENIVKIFLRNGVRLPKYFETYH